MTTRTDLLAIAAHPDDVELNCGGLMIKMSNRGYRVGILDLTRGEMGTRGTPGERESEATAAAEILGAGFRENAGLPDGRLRVDEEARVAVATAIRAHRPTVVVAPYWKDSHPDHGHAGRLAHEGAFVAGLRKYPGLAGDAHRPAAILYWPSHYDFRPSFVVDISEEHDRKHDAIRAFRSQLHEPTRDEPETNISSATFLKRVETRERVFGEMIGVAYGEAFLVRQVVPIDDPIAAFAGSDREWNGTLGLLS